MKKGEGEPTKELKDKTILDLCTKILDNINNAYSDEKKLDKDSQDILRALHSLLKIIDIKNKIDSMQIAEPIVTEPFSPNSITFHDIIIILNFCKSCIEKMI